MRCCQIMTTDYVVYAPEEPSSDLLLRWRDQRFVLVLENHVPKGIVSGEVLQEFQSAASGSDPSTLIKNALRPISICQEQDTLGFAGAKVLRDRAVAAVIYRGDCLLGVAPLLDILHWLIASPAPSRARELSGCRVNDAPEA